MDATMSQLTVAIGEDDGFTSIKVGDVVKTAIRDEQFEVLRAAHVEIVRLFDNEPTIDGPQARQWIEELSAELRAADSALNALWWVAPEAGDE